MEQDTQDSLPDETISPSTTRHTVRSPWRKLSDDKPAGATPPAAAQPEPLSEEPRPSATPPAASTDDKGERTNPMFGSGLRRVVGKDATDTAGNQEAAPAAPAVPNRGGFKLGRAFEEQVAKPDDSGTETAKPVPSKPEPAAEPVKRKLDSADRPSLGSEGLGALRRSARAMPPVDASDTAADGDDALSMPSRAPRASEESAMMPPRADAAPRPPRGGFKMPDSVRNATAQSLNPDDSAAGLSVAKDGAAKDNKFSLHRRFTKAGWTVIIVSQLVFATALVIGVRRYFGVGQGETPAAPVSPIVAATQTATAAQANAAAPVATIAPAASVAKIEPTRVAPTAAPAATTASEAPSAPAQPPAAGGDFEARASSSDNAAPFYGPSYSPTDGKPVYVCAAPNDGASLALLHMQMAGLDVENGFHLGVVPLGFDKTAYTPSMAEQAAALNSKTWDCLFANVDEAAQRDLGVVTAIVDENVGGYGIWSRAGLRSYDDLRGRTVGYVRDTSSQYFARYVLGIMTKDVRDSVRAEAFDTMDAALDAFNNGAIDAVTLPDSFLRLRGVRGARAVVDSAQLRVIVGGVVTSRPALAERADMVKRFHTAYFQALKQQSEDIEASASRVANWGNAAWSGVSRGSAAADLRQLLTLSAQATGEQNAALARDTAPVLSVMSGARELYLSTLADTGAAAPTLPEVSAQIDLSYAAEASAAAKTNAPPFNASFSLRAASAEAAPTAAPVAGASETVAVLPCRKFTFEPDSARLTDESRRVLDLCVTPALKQRDGLFLLVRGSAAWPGPKGTYSETQIREIANSRAKAITEYLISQQIDPARFKIESVLPPAERRDTDDPIKQAEDRWVEMSLIASGR